MSTPLSAKIIATLFLACISLFHVSAQAANNIQTLMKASGMTQQLEHIPALIKAGVEQAAGEGANNAEKVQFLKGISGAFDAKQLVASVQQKISQNVNNQEASKLLKWYQSSAGKKIADEEVKALAQMGNYEQATQTIAKLKDLKDRTALATAMEKVVKSTEFTMAIQEYAAYAGVKAAMPTASQEQLKPIMDMIKGQLQQSNSGARKALINSTVFAHRNIPLPELKKYLSFLEQPLTRKFYGSAMDGTEMGLQKGIDRWMQDISKNLKK